MKIALAIAGSLMLHRRLFGTREIQRTQFPGALKGMIISIFHGGGEGHNYKLAVAQNQSLNWAREINADWLIMWDADSVLCHAPTQFPSSGFGTSRMLHAKKFQRSFTGLDVNNPANFPESSSRFIIHRDFFNRAFCEDFIGHGWEDADFYHHAMKGVEQTPCDLRGIHLWHPPRGTARGFETNQARYKGRHLTA